MSSLTVKTLRREFFYNGTRVPDPAPNLIVYRRERNPHAFLPRDRDSNTGGTGRYRRRPSLHFQPRHWQQGLISALHAVSHPNLVPRVRTPFVLQGRSSP
jgi:hypothetical protein